MRNGLSGNRLPPGTDSVVRPPQHGRAEDPGTVAEAGTEDFRVEFGIEKMPSDRLARPVLVENIKIPDAAADHHRIRIKKIENSSQRLGKFFAQPFERSNSQFFALGRTTGDLGQSDGLPSLLAIKPLQRRPRENRLHTPPTPAVTRMRLPGDGIVPPLACDAVTSIQNPTMDDQSAAYSGSKDHPKNHVVPDARP